MSPDNQPDVLLINQGGKQGGVPGTFANSGAALGRTSGRAVALADLDNDNDLDVIVIGNNMITNTLWLNQGSKQGGTPGVFLDSGQRLSDSGGQAVAAADIDGDDDIDLLITDGGPSFNHILLNQGGEQDGVLGIFQAAGELTCDTGCASLALGDLDNDNDLDIFFVGGPHPVPAKVLLNQIREHLSPAAPNATGGRLCRQWHARRH
ncbi:MAG: FG-GAP-like repeat-containing protein [Caldilineaceae bacterium]